MSTGKVSGAHQKFFDDLSAGKNEIVLKQFGPVFQRLWMMAIQPSFERSIFTAQVLDAPSIFDCRIHLKAIPNDARIV
jgi:hypothetical protein